MMDRNCTLKIPVLLAGLALMLVSTSAYAQSATVNRNNAASSLGTNQQVEPCDCSNCSADHCNVPTGAPAIIPRWPVVGGDTIQTPGHNAAAPPPRRRTNSQQIGR